jgi:mRNA interferase MazF
MIEYNKNEIVLVPFPFTNFTTSKKRPALIISPNEYNSEDDLIIAFITSNIFIQNKIGDYKIKDWKDANLPSPSLIRMKFATIHKSIVIKKLGKLTDRDSRDFWSVFNDFFSKSQ